MTRRDRKSTERKVLHFPVLRQGFIVSSGRAFPRNIAERIAEEFSQQFHLVLDATAAAISKLDIASPVLESIEAAKQGAPTTRPSPTLVIDFPPVIATVGALGVELRSCVTVCVENRESKIWTRVNSLERDVDQAMIEPLFDKFEQITSVVNHDIMMVYQNLARSIVGKDLSLSKTYEINVRTASNDDPFVEEYIDEVFDRENDKNIDANLKEKVESSIREIDSRFAVIPAVEEEKIGDGKNSSNRRQIGFVGIRAPTTENRFPLDQVRVVYALEYNDKKAVLAGFGYDPYWQRATPRDSLAHVASANVAVEYGSLF